MELEDLEKKIKTLESDNTRIQQQIGQLQTLLIENLGRKKALLELYEELKKEETEDVSSE